MDHNIWNLNWFAYLLGFLFVPRITIILIFNNYVTKGFEWSNLLVGITIWWKYPLLNLSFWNKIGFSVLFALFPRLLLGIIGYQYFPQNHGIMVTACVVGFIIDIAVKIATSARNSDG